mmetsp:Transcript_17761/g.28916  ORF Transcript_17761/g.28916 Transcript_17761/m.28916 type:complete len:347 (+) Transcript_17761:38-1078(+)
MADSYSRKGGNGCGSNDEVSRKRKSPPIVSDDVDNMSQANATDGSQNKMLKTLTAHAAEDVDNISQTVAEDVDSIPQNHSRDLENARHLAESATECAICFQSDVQCEELPCSCTVSYCTSCWDQALVASFRSYGASRCPTCRRIVRVDVESSLQESRYRLKFSLETRDEASLDPEEEMRRLALQAAPLQIQLLGHYKAADADSLPECSNEHKCPPCVCGKSLRFMSVEQRTAEAGIGNVICDLCEKRIRRRANVWYCNNTTVVHPGAFDACESCFDKYTKAEGGSASCNTQQEEQEESEESDELSDLELDEQELLRAWLEHGAEVLEGTESEDELPSSPRSEAGNE